MKGIAHKIKTLVDELNLYSYHYHSLDESLISDEHYDRLFLQLQHLEEQYPQYKLDNSPTNKVGDQVSTKFARIVHAKPMLSLNNIFSDLSIDDVNVRHQELLQFDKRVCKNLGVNNVQYVAMLKYDGVAISLIYKHGVLVHGVTRGDGFTGEDVTNNIKTIYNIPKTLKDAPDIFEVRGEILITKEDFALINDAKRFNNQKLFANPRNLASGSIRQLDPSITRSRPLRFFAYSIMSDDMYATFDEQLQYLRHLGFELGCEYKICTTFDELIEYYEQTIKNRADIAFGIDGVVYKVNSIKYQQELGFVMRSPRFAVAHKFKGEIGITQVLDVKMQVGRTGTITPVAKLAPTLVGGVMVSSASLHNFDEIVRKDIRINDYVTIHRAGDVIPEVLEVLLDRRDNDIVKLVAKPNYCPVCSSLIIRDEVNIKCSGDLSCSAQKIQAITHFCSKLALDIAGMGEQTVNQLVNNNLISNVADIFVLKIADVAVLDGFGDKRASNLLDAINVAKNTSLARLIYALGILHVGEATAKDLAKHFGTLEALTRATYEQLLDINSVGTVTASAIVSFLSNSGNKDIIEQLFRHGVTCSANITNSAASIFSGKNIVLTGTMDKYSRITASEIIESLGGRVSSSVSKNTDLVIVGSDAGSKLNRALDLGITIMHEDEFDQHIRQ